MINEGKRKVSPDEILNFIGFGPFQVVAFLLASSTYLAYGCDGSLFILVGSSVQKEWNISVTEYAILPASTSIPNVLGAILFSVMSDQFGRLWPYALCMGWITVFSVASAFSNSFYLFIALRCLASFAIGGISGFVNPTIVEFLPVLNRGKVMVLNILVGSLGICLSCGLAWWLIPYYPVYGWRFYVIASGVPSALVCAFRLLFYFESPRFLITKGKVERAWKIFEIIARVNGRNLSEFVCSETCAIELTELRKRSSVISRPMWVQFLKMFHPSWLRITLPLTVIIVTETVGFLSSQLFLPNFLENVGVSTYFTIMVTSVAQLPGSLLLSIIVEWPEIGRLKSFRIFSSLSMIFFILLAFIQTPVSIPVFLILIYFSTAPIMGLTYSYISEFYPTSIRSVATAYFYICQALTNIVGSMAISKAVDIPQHWLFPAVFATCYFVQLMVGFIMNYEPLGRRLRDKT